MMDLSSLVYVHVTGGAVAIAAGFVALFAPKGEAVHRLAGSVFFIAMIAMTSSALIVAVVRDQRGNIGVASLTLYLVLTSWMAAQRKDRQSGTFEQGALAGILGVAALAYLMAANAAKDIVGGLYFIAGLALFSALLDASVIVRGGLAGAQRIARHLWRMTFAMFVATGSYFLGQPKFVPDILRETKLNFVPPLVVVALLLFWLARVLLTRWWTTAPKAEQEASPARAAAGHLSRATTLHEGDAT